MLSPYDHVVPLLSDSSLIPHPSALSFLLPHFPAWALARTRPRVTRLAVHLDGRVVAATTALRREGLKVGEPVDRVRLLFPDATLERRDAQLENAVWEDLLHLLNQASPHILSLEPGWALVTPYDVGFLRDLARTLGARAGVARRRLAAMIASLAAEDGETIVVDDDEAFVSRASVDHLVGLGMRGELVERLKLFGLRRLGDVARLTLRQLKAQFGQEGKALFTMLHPEGEEPPIPLFVPPPSVASQIDFDPPAVEPAELEPALRELVRRTTEELGGLLAQRVTLRLVGPRDEGTRITPRLLKAPTAKGGRIHLAAETILRAMLRSYAPVERMSLELGALVEPAAIQSSLFFNRLELYEAVRQIHRRYPGVLVRATIVDPHAYIPEEGVRFEEFPTEPPAGGGRRKKKS